MLGFASTKPPTIERDTLQFYLIDLFCLTYLLIKRVVGDRSHTTDASGSTADGAGSGNSAQNLSGSKHDDDCEAPIGRGERVWVSQQGRR